jgi:septal ring factor EnvC (AmiA/AmiB activator)
MKKKENDTMKAMNDYVTQNQLEKTLDKALEKNNKIIIDQMSEVMGDMMDRIDQRFSKVENDIAEIKEEIIDLKESHNRLMNTIDGFVKRLEDYEVESRARDAQYERLVSWAKEVSKKTGIPLPSL